MSAHRTTPAAHERLEEPPIPANRSVKPGTPPERGEHDTAPLTDRGGQQLPGSRWATVWGAFTATLGAVMGLLPHLLHHLTFIAGAALVTGLGGNLVFGALGLVLSIPLLRRLYARFGTWKAPAAATVAFTAMFVLSATVIGPTLVGDDTATPRTPTPTQVENHDQHH